MRTRFVGIGALICAFALTAVAYGAVTPIPPGDPGLSGCPPDPHHPGGVALQGDDADDDITGTPKNDLLRGGGGDDTIAGIPGEDCLEGQDGKDKIKGGGGNDLINFHGGGGEDTISGGLGSDFIYGGNGKDKINGNQNVDALRGGDGNDLIDAREDENRRKDKIDCGGGFDTVYTDKRDVVKNCERVNPS